VKHLGYTITNISAFAETVLEAENITTTHQTHMRIPLDERDETPFCAFCANGTVIITRNNEKT